MGRHCAHSAPDRFIGKQNSQQRFDPRDPEMEILLRGLLHELRNPLSSILTAATLLQDSPPPDTSEMGEEYQMLLEVVKKESLRLNYILTEFAGYIKLPPPQPGNFDLARAIRTVVRELQHQGVLTPPIEVKDELPVACAVWGDENQIRTALAHILRNAAEAMPNSGQLRLRECTPSHSGNPENPTKETGETAEKVVICVSDSGKGFTSESRDRAFQPFYSSKEHSIGLGLSSVLTLIEAANGRVWLQDNAPIEASTDPEPSTSSSSQATSSLSICFELPRSKP